MSKLVVSKQLDADTCGATCAHAIHRYYKGRQSLGRVSRSVKKWPIGGTIMPLLGMWAANQGYRTELWRSEGSKRHSGGYAAPWVIWELLLDLFRDRGGAIAEESARTFIRRHLIKGHPLIAEISEQTLYHRKGDGHFVVIAAAGPEFVAIEDPYYVNKKTGSRSFEFPWPTFMRAMRSSAKTYGGCLLAFWPST